MNGFVNDEGEVIIIKNVSYAMELFEQATKEGNLEAKTNIANFYINGIIDDHTGIVLLKPNITKALEHLIFAADGDSPIAYHMMGELI